MYFVFTDFGVIGPCGWWILDACRYARFARNTAHSVQFGKAARESGRGWQDSASQIDCLPELVIAAVSVLSDIPALGRFVRSG